MEFNKITTRQEAQDLAKRMPDIIALDTEYVKGNPRTTQLLSVIIADSERAWVVPPSLLPEITPALRSRRAIFLQEYNHNDTVILFKHDCDIRDVNCYNLIDIHHLLDENADHDLGSRVHKVYGDNYKDEFWSKYNNFEDAEEYDALEYACKDAIYTYRLGVSDLKQVNIDLYEHIRKLRRALLDTELEGIYVDMDLIKVSEEKVRKQIEGYLPKLREEFFEYVELWELQKWQEEIEKRKTVAGRERVKRPVFNFGSNEQLAWLLYTAMGLPVVQETKKGNPSTDYDTIKSLGESDLRLKTLVDYADIKNAYATFYKGILERVEHDGTGHKILPNFNVSGTVTGRISHTNPNMGNLPKEGVIRNFFLPSPGHVIIGADYSQLEVVIELNLTEDDGLREIVVDGKSKHDLFKAELDAAGFNLPRSQVKNVNFALQYGAGAKKITKMVGCSEEEAERIIGVFYKRFSGVKRLKDEVERIIKTEGKITNLAGRVRHFDRPKNKFDFYRQCRQAYNFLIQGVAGEACNRAFYRIAEELKTSGVGRALFNVHDEIVLEVKEKEAEYWKSYLTSVMERSTGDFNFKYPLKAVAYGPMSCWSKA